MKKLPGKQVLGQLFALGHTATQVAEQYGCSPQAVLKQWGEMGLSRYPVAKMVVDRMNAVWSVQSTAGVGSHFHSFPCQSLRYYLRLKLGDTLSPTQEANARRFERRLIRERVVLDYSPERGFSYVARSTGDGLMLIRWPADKPQPSEEEARFWSFQAPPGMALGGE
ncbi:hypothetical protein [Kitasatospora cineracea]|uniref:hypothetical protein n=1 Tax=Kitasatospora cineracea TaxID=88074 RepID=UPI00383067B4